MNLEATPFISQYRFAAIGVVVGLFILEAITNPCRVIFNALAANVVNIVVYFLVGTTLTVCYLSCAVAIIRRIGLSGTTHWRLRRMTLRFAVSVLGYSIFVLASILLGVLGYYVIPSQILYFVSFAALNFVAILQVAALSPTSKFRYSSRNKKTRSTSGGSTKAPISVTASAHS